MTNWPIGCEWPDVSHTSPGHKALSCDLICYSGIWRQIVYPPWRKALDPYWTTSFVSSTLCCVNALRLRGFALRAQPLWLMQGVPGQSGEVPASTQQKFIYRIRQPSGQGLKCHNYNVSLFHREEELSWAWIRHWFCRFLHWHSS